MAASSFDSPEYTVLNVSEEKTNGTRLARLLIDGGTHALRKFLDHIHRPEKLKDELNFNKQRLQALRNRHVISETQWERLFPSSGDAPDSRTFDITLLHLLLREICHLTAPSTGWHNMPADDDTSPGASITKIKCFRNELCHSISTGVSNDEFEEYWNKISLSLMSLESILFQQRLDGLKNDPIDHDTQRRVNESVEKWKRSYEMERQQENQQSIEQTSPEPSSCLPDELPDECIFGRSEDIQLVIDAVQSGKFSVVLITGGPGFGKTALANKVTHALAKPECGQTVLFCSLRSKATLNGVATEMILACGKSSAQPPAHPVHWLKSWCSDRSSHTDKQVTFVLDNVDDILNSEDRDRFSSTLSEMRTLSRQNVAFVVTSRNAFNAGTLQIAQIRLHCLSPEKAKELLLSRAPNLENQKNFSKAEELVELSGRVPLALCLIGSLLSDYNEDKLVQRLQEDSLSTLQDGEVSVEKAIKTSFDLLDECEKQALILMSVFHGSFNSDAAEAVMRAYPQAQNREVSILRSLKNRSLVEQPSSCRYQIHPLIQKFLKKKAQEQQLLAQAKSTACAHFISRISDNADIFWGNRGKDRCRETVESFNVDRHNFEHFLQVYVLGIENQDPAIMETTEALLNNFPQKCMYLEMCLLPKVYMKLLKGFLNIKVLEEQPACRVELLCLLGHEIRRVDRKAYSDYMKNTKELYDSNRSEFETKPLSKVLFLNSYARSLSQESIREAKEMKMSKSSRDLYTSALKVCEEKLPANHPQTAATLLFTGRHDKYCRKFPQSEENLKKAFNLFNSCLGKHVMTAFSLKDLADFYFSCGKLDDSIAQYEDVLKIMEEVGMKDQKKCILTLKNLGGCYRKKGNFEKALNILQKADDIAERELEGDNEWKAKVKTEKAIALFHKCSDSKSRESAQAMVTEGLKMWERLGLSKEELPNIDDLRKVFTNIL